jgi:phage tail sheath protein FI
MAETLISPGVLARENDQSALTGQPITVGAAIIGPTVKGPVEVPTLVTSYSDYLQKFGSTFTSGSQVYTYFTSIAAYNYFLNGGETLLVARVVSGSSNWTPATTSSGSVSATNGTSIVTTGSNTVESFILETLSEGTIMNSSSSLDSAGALASGTSNNVRWQIVNSSATNGTFDLLIRRGDDTTNNPNVLETWTNLSLDPYAPNFISAVIGDYIVGYNTTTQQVDILSGSYPNRSAYVRVKSVVSPTPNYFLNNGQFNPAYTASLPLNASGSFTSATGSLFGTSTAAAYYEAITVGTNIQGLTSTDYNDMITCLANQDDYRFNVLLAPGLFDSLSSTQCTNIINNTQNRGDSIFVLDLVPYNVQTPSTVVAQAQNRNTSYAASYWPWCQVKDPDSGKNVWVPASTLVGGVYAYNDSVSEPWFAPAGINRGGLNTVIRAAQRLSQSNRDTLYSGKVNPIATFPGTGVVVYGQKTLQTKASALDRVNVRRLLIALKGYISQVAQNLVFEQNTIATRNQFLAQVNPYLESVQQRQGLYAFRVIMDDSNNTPDVIDRNQLIGQIYIQPTKTAEFIYLDFNILPTGATFPA